MGRILFGLTAGREGLVGWLGESKYTKPRLYPLLTVARYYEDMGFKPVDSFEIPSRNNTMWQGKLFRMDLA